MTRETKTCVRADGSHKMVYPSQDAAIMACRALNARESQDFKVRPYYCSRCRGWHIGRSHQKLSDEQRKRCQTLQALNI